MCRVLRVVIVAPPERQLELRRAISALDSDVVASVDSVASLDIRADVALAWEPDEETVAALRGAGLKVASVGGSEGDLTIDPDDVAAFRTLVWELFRP